MASFRHQHRTGLAEYLRSHPHPGGIIVCQKPRFIYMKAPRTGGTSVFRHTLEKMSLDMFHYKDHPARFGEWLSRLTDADLEEYFIFAFVRNPWDRAVSIASYFQIPFEQFAGSFHQLVARDRNLMQHSLPLHGYAYRNDELFVDFLGHFETLQTVFERLCGILGLPPTRLPVSSQSIHQPYANCYDTHIKRQIDQIYHKDVECLGYCFGE